MGKKRKTDVEKRRTKSKQRAQKKRKLRLLKSSSNQHVQVSSRPGLPHLGAPEGFRSIGMAQAMMEYAKPLMELREGNQEDFEGPVQTAMLLWNYALSVEEGRENRKIEKDILKAIMGSFGLDKAAARALFAKMTERRSHLFPPDIQPRGSPFMFIRKEVRHIIRTFDYDTLSGLSDKSIPADDKDQALVDRIKELDHHMRTGADYEEYEDLFFSLKDDCQGRFEKWLVDKGMKKDPWEFSSCLHTFLDFIYGYMHDDIVILKSIPDIYFVEFFEDFLLRKMMAEPNEYVYWPPALKLFYRFLHEKGYIESPAKIIEAIGKVEPYFIEVLRKQFS